MEKEKMIEKLLNEKASKNNTIDLNAYAIGLSDMYDKLKQPQVNGSFCYLYKSICMGSFCSVTPHPEKCTYLEQNKR